MIEKNITSKPCLEFELIISINAITIRIMLNNLYTKGKFFINSPNKANNSNIASVDEAKFGLPRVEIMGLYGLFHLIKSFPAICINP